MPRLRHVAVTLAVLAAVAGIAGVAVALPGGSSSKSAAEQAPSRQATAASAQPRHAAPAPATSVPAATKAKLAAQNAQRAHFYAGVLHAQQARFYAGVNHTLQVRRARQAQLARFYAGVHKADLDRSAAIARWVAGLQRGKAWGAAIARWEAGVQRAAAERNAAIARWVAGVQNGKALGDAIARWEAGLHRAPAPAASSGGASSGSYAGITCGGALPTCCILQHESGGNPTAMNPSGAAGLWQFMPGTWAGYGGYASAAQAPVSVQNAKAVQVWAGGAGASNWAGDGC